MCIWTNNLTDLKIIVNDSWAWDVANIALLSKDDVIWYYIMMQMVIYIPNFHHQLLPQAQNSLHC